MHVLVKVDDLKDGQLIELLAQHHAQMSLYSPPESIHALGRRQLYDPATTFCSAWVAGGLAGCGALKQLAIDSGEIKAMRTAPAYWQKVVAAKILEQILTTARSRDYNRVSLETGVHKAFHPAINLYRKYGFSTCDPFTGYSDDPFRQCFSRE
jgi:putative acetyltransferase